MPVSPAGSGMERPWTTDDAAFATEHNRRATSDKYVHHQVFLAEQCSFSSTSARSGFPASVRGLEALGAACSCPAGALHNCGPPT